MNNMQVLYNALDKAFKNNYIWGLFDLEVWKEASELEKLQICRTLLEESMYFTIIFNHDFAKALWGEKDYMAYYVGYNEWADATEPQDEAADFDEVQHNRMPLWQYHLQQMVVERLPLRYLGKNL